MKSTDTLASNGNGKYMGMHPPQNGSAALQGAAPHPTDPRATADSAAPSSAACIGPAPPAYQEQWLALTTALLGRIPSEQFETWFRRAALVHVDAQVVRLAFQNEFTLNWVETNYREVLEKSVAESIEGAPKIEFLVDSELSVRRHVETDAPAPGPSGREGESSSLRGRQAEAGRNGNRLTGAENGASHRSQGAQRLNLHMQEGRVLSGASSRLDGSSDVTLNGRYLFDHFVVGPCNRLAHAAAVGVSERPGTLYNPYFLHGSVGLGKTHLQQALCHALLDRDPNIRILYLSCETFVNHFISALENGDLQKFRGKYRGIDVLVVDDIHLLANKERTQEEFFHTFNTLYNAGKQIVLSSDSPPKEIPTLQERLVSRFKWGLVAEIEKPCYETRMAILKRKSKERGHELPDDVASILAERIDNNIRELEGAVTKLLGYASLCGRPLDVELAAECLRDVFTVRNNQPTMDDILRVVTGHFGVKLSDLQSRKRTNAIAFPRQVGMYLARKVTRLSLEEIGGYFGGRDHSTVIHAVQKLTKLSRQDPDTRELLLEREAALRNGLA